MSEPIHFATETNLSFEVPPGFTLLNNLQKGPAGPLKTIAISPDGHTLASGSEDNTVRIWDLTNGKLTQTFEGDNHSFYDVAWSPDGRLLAAGSYDTTIRLCDPKSGKLQQTLEGHDSSITSVAWS